MRCEDAVEWETEGRRRLNLDCGLESWRPNTSMWLTGWPPSPADRQEWKPTLRSIIFRLTSGPDK